MMLHGATRRGVTVKITGSLEMFAAVMDDISESRVYMTVLGFAFILVFLILVYRKFNAISPIIRSSSLWAGTEGSCTCSAWITPR